MNHITYECYHYCSLPVAIVTLQNNDRCSYIVLHRTQNYFYLFTILVVVIGSVITFYWIMTAIIKITIECLFILQHHPEYHDRTIMTCVIGTRGGIIAMIPVL